MSPCFSSEIFNDDYINHIIFTIFAMLLSIIALTMKVMYNHNQVINEFEMKIDRLLTKIENTYSEMIDDCQSMTTEDEYE